MHGLVVATWYGLDWSVFPVNQYLRLRGLLHKYAKKYLTTRAVARYLLKVAEKPTVLFFLDRTNNRCCPDGQSQACKPCDKDAWRVTDYTDIVVMHGFKSLLGTDFHVYPLDPPFLFWDYPETESRHLYGRGAMYSRRLNPILKSTRMTEETLQQRIRSRFYDAVVYGGEWRITPKPHFSLVKECIEPSSILHLEGGDSQQHHTYGDGCEHYQHHWCKSYR